MKYEWYIDHDNGVPGQCVCSDDYIMTNEEIREEIERMQAAGITVYGYGRMSFNVYQ